MNLLIGIFIVFAGLANAQTKSTICSSAGGQVEFSHYETSQVENKALNKSQFKIKVVTMAGRQEIKLDLKNLNYVFGSKQVLETKKSSADTVCKIPMKTVSETFVQRVYFAKEDGTPIAVDDTPQSSLKSVNETLLCESSVTEAWPCN